MLKYILALFILLSTVISAQTPQQLPVDQYRGPWSDTIDLDARGYAYRIETQNVFRGLTALRFELRDGDCYTAYPENPSRGWDDCVRDRERTEVRERWNAPVDVSMWYQIHLYIPEDYTPMYPKQIFMQWHNGSWGPNVYFHLNNNRFHVDILTQPGLTTTQYTFGDDILTLGRWHEIMVNVTWSADPTRGHMTLYVNDRLLIDHRGATLDAATYESGIGPFFKYGIYRSHLFRYQYPGPHPTHVLYFDEYRRGYSQQQVEALNHPGD